jgi:hypothetical protein
MRDGVQVANKDSRFSFQGGPSECSRKRDPGRVRPPQPVLLPVGAIVGLGGLGYLVDRVARFGALGVIVGLLLGFVVGFYELVKAVRSR